MKKIRRKETFYSKLTMYLYLALLIICFTGMSKVYAQDTVRFVQISDNHLNPYSERVNLRMVKYSKELLEDAIDQINNMQNIDFVIFTGDMADNTSLKLHKIFLEIANKLNVPWYWTTGNHDLGQSGETLGRKKLLNLMNKYNKTIQPDNTCYSFQKGGVIFFAMDGANDKISTANGTFSEECLGILESGLTRHEDMPAVIFQHFPIVYPIKSESHEVTNQTEYLNLLDRHKNVKALFSGHYHIEKNQTRNKVLHASAPSLIQYPNAFRVVTLTREGKDLNIDIKTVETRLKNVQKMSLESKK